MTNHNEEINLEGLRDLLEPKLRQHRAAMIAAAEAVANEIISTGQLSEEGRNAFYDENMLQATILGAAYREAAESRGVILSDDYISNMESRVFDSNNASMEEMVSRLESLAIENWVPAED